MEEEIEIAQKLTMGLLERMGVETEVEGFLKEGRLYLKIRGDREGILIGRHGRTLDSLQMIITRMINKQLSKPVKVVLDIDDYRERKADNLTKMAVRWGEKAKRMGRALTIGPFNAHDRRIIHMALKEDPSLGTESFGEGDIKKITIVPKRKEG
ncbi:MAG: R3H domain-containing nucleic acid-binding protein [Thermodesulfobacteriota bacterium]